MGINMRLRNVPGAREAMIESEYTVNEPKEYKGEDNSCSDQMSCLIRG